MKPVKGASAVVWKSQADVSLLGQSQFTVKLRYASDAGFSLIL